jgi:hypothetical protein
MPFKGADARRKLVEVVPGDLLKHFDQNGGFVIG